MKTYKVTFNKSVIVKANSREQAEEKAQQEQDIEYTEPIIKEVKMLYFMLEDYEERKKCSVCERYYDKSDIKKNEHNEVFCSQCYLDSESFKI